VHTPSELRPSRTVDGKTAAQGNHLRPNPLDRRFRAARLNYLGNEVAHLFHFAFLKPRVVAAGVPMRRPLAIDGGRGFVWIAFLLTVMLARRVRHPHPAGHRVARQGEQEQMVVGAAGRRSENPAP